MTSPVGLVLAPLDSRLRGNDEVVDVVQSHPAHSVIPAQAGIQTDD